MSTSRRIRRMKLELAIGGSSVLRERTLERRGLMHELLGTGKYAEAKCHVAETYRELKIDLASDLARWCRRRVEGLVADLCVCEAEKNVEVFLKEFGLDVGPELSRSIAALGREAATANFPERVCREFRRRANDLQCPELAWGLFRDLEQLGLHLLAEELGIELSEADELGIDLSAEDIGLDFAAEAVTALERIIPHRPLTQ